MADLGLDSLRIALVVACVGLGSGVFAAGWSIEYFFRAFKKIKRHFRKLELASGFLLMGVGVMLATDQFSRLNSQFAFMTRFVNAAERAIQ